MNDERMLFSTKKICGWIHRQKSLHWLIADDPLWCSDVILCFLVSLDRIERLEASMSNFVLQYVHKTSVSVLSTSFKYVNSSRNAVLNLVLVFGIVLSKIFSQSLAQVILERTKRFFEIEEVFKLQKAKSSSHPENPAFGGFPRFLEPICRTVGIDSKSGTSTTNWGRMASLVITNLSKVWTHKRLKQNPLRLQSLAIDYGLNSPHFLHF
jgi:hypothetical protein